MAHNSAAYHQMYDKVGKKRNHGHAHDHRYGRIYWSYRIAGAEVKCAPPRGRQDRRGF
jgi:hypothetical protein